jgi:hypothetical protein
MTRSRKQGEFMPEFEVVPNNRPIAGLISHRGTELVGRQDLVLLPTPDATQSHRPIPHAALVGAVIETLGFRKLAVVEDQYAVSPDGMRLFGVLALDLEENGVRVSIGLRNSHDKSFALGITIGYRVFVCDNMAFHGDFQTVTRKHSKNLVLNDVLAVAIDRMQRNFVPMLNQVDVWKGYELPDASAKLIIYRAFIEEDLAVPKHLADDVHRLYFSPEYDEFRPRTMWSLSNAFTSAFKDLEPIPRFKATARLAPFLAEFNRDK